VYVIFPDGGKLRKLKKHTRVMTYGLHVTSYSDKKYYTEKKEGLSKNQLLLIKKEKKIEKTGKK